MPSVGEVKGEVTGVVARAKATPAWRAWSRYGQLRGGLLAGGIAYTAFFSLLPALAVGFTVFGLVIGNNPDLENRVVAAVNKGIGTTVIGDKGIISLSALTGGTQLTIAGIAGLVGLLLTGLGWLDAMREGVRAMFGQPPAGGNVVVTKLRDVFVLATLGVLILASAVSGFLVGAAAGWLLGLVGIANNSTIGSVVLSGLGTLVLLGVDTVIFMVLFRLLAGVHLPRHDLWDAALFGGIGLGLLKLFASLLLRGASHNKFLATFAVVIVLLVWLNLVSRLTLVAASWGATVALDRGHLVDAGVPLLAETAPLGQPPVRAETAKGPTLTPVVSPRGADRVSIAAGAVLGAGTAVALRVAGSAVRNVARALRHDDSDD